MAFRQLGVEFIHKGLNNFTQAIDRVNRAYREYSRSRIEAARADVYAARSANTLTQALKRQAESGFNQSINAVKRYSAQMQKFLTGLDSYQRYVLQAISADAIFKRGIVDINIKMRENADITRRLNTATNANTVTTKKYTDQLNKNNAEIAEAVEKIAILAMQYGASSKQQEQLYKTAKKYIEVLTNQNASLDDVKVAMAEFKQAMLEADEAQQKLSSAESNWHNITEQTMRFAKGLTIVHAATGDVIAIFQVLGDVFRFITGIFGKALSIIGNLALAIGKTLFNAIKKIISIPINMIKGIFNAFTGGLQRIFEIVIGMNLSRIIWGLGRQFRSLAVEIYNAGVEFQFTQIRLRGLLSREYRDAGYSLGEAMGYVGERAKELTDWITKLSVLSPVSSDEILNTMTLAMSYNFTSKEAQTLTEAIVKFSTAMGLGNEETRRIIENFGQMRQQGKLAGTELRDLARGAFVPVTDILKRMGINLEVVSGVAIPSLTAINTHLLELKSTGKITSTEFNRVDKALREFAVGSSISAFSLKELYTTGIISKKVFDGLGISLEDLDTATSDLSFDEMKKELNELLKTGKITVDEFFWAFVDIVEEDFSDALDNASESMKIIQQNIKDFRETMIGWRIITPILDVVSKKFSAAMKLIMNNKTITFFDNFGKVLGMLTEILFGFVDSLMNLSSYKNTIGGIIEFLSTLFGVIASFGSEDVEVFTNALHSLKNFLYHIPDFTGEESIVAGIKLLKETFEGMGELDSQTILDNLKTSLSLIWTPLKEQIIIPKLQELYADIKEFVLDKWENDIKPAFTGFLENTILPGLSTFVLETIPSWASTLATHAPTIATALGTTISNAFGALATSAEENFGEGSIWTTVFETLQSLTDFLMMKTGLKEIPYTYETPTIKKFEDPYKASGLADSIRDLGAAAEEAVGKLKTFVIEALQPLGAWMDEHATQVEFVDKMFERISLAAQNMSTFAGIIADIFSILSLGGVEKKGEGEGLLDKLEPIYKVMNFILDIQNWVAEYLTPAIGLTIRTALRTVAEITELIFTIIRNIGAEEKTPLDFDIGAIFDPMFKWTEGFDEEKVGPMQSLRDFIDSLSEIPAEMENVVTGISAVGNEGSYDKVPFTDLIAETLGIFDTFSLTSGTTGQSPIDIMNNTLLDLVNIGNEGSYEKVPFEDMTNDIKEKWENLDTDLIGESIIPEMVTAIQTYFDDNVPLLLVPFTNFKNDLVNEFILLKTSITEKMIEIYNEVKTKIDEIVSTVSGVNLYPIGQSMLQGLLDGMKQKFDEILEWWELEALEKLLERIQLLYDMGSPSRVFEKYGVYIIQGLQIGMEKQFGKLTNSFAGNMGNLSAMAGHVTSGSITNNSYQNSLDNRNIIINIRNAGSVPSLDYEYVKGLI